MPLLLILILCTGAYTAMTVFVLGPALQGLLFVLVPVLQGPPKSEPKVPAATFVPNIFSRPGRDRSRKKVGTLLLACIARTDFVYWGLYCAMCWKACFCVLGNVLESMVLSIGPCVGKARFCVLGPLLESMIVCTGPCIGNSGFLVLGPVLESMTLCTGPCTGKHDFVYWAL